MKRPILLSNQRAADPAAGFTVVELLISMVVFSLVLVVITVGVLHFTNSYYKGVNSSSTQTTAQDVIDTVSQAIQFGGGTPVLDNGSGTHFCAGGKKFLYNLGVEMGASPVVGNRGLYVVPTDATCSDDGSVPAGGTELLSKGMRLTSPLLGNTSPGIYTVNIHLVYGDSDLLCDADTHSTPSSSRGSCTGNAPSNAPGATILGDSIQCASTVGSQFCSVATLSTVALQRVTN